MPNIDRDVIRWIDYKQRMQNAVSQVDGKAFSALLDYKLVFPELLDRKITLNKVLNDYCKERRDEETTKDRKKMDFLAAAFYCSLPIGVHITNDPVEALRQGVKRAKNEVGEAIATSTSGPSALTTSTFSTNHETLEDASFSCDFHYVFIARDSPKMGESYFSQYLTALDSSLSKDMISYFAKSMPNACRINHLATETDIQHFMSTMFIIPIVEFFDDAFAEGEGVFSLYLEQGFEVLLSGRNYPIISDTGIDYEGKVLVNIRVKYPSIAEPLNKMQGYLFTNILTEVFYECVAAGTPYTVVTDGECMLLLEICGLKDPVTFKLEDRGEPSKPHVQDLGIPIVMKYHLVKKSDSKLTMMSTLTALVYAAYDRLVVQGKRAEIARDLSEMAVKLKVTEEQKQLKLQKKLQTFEA